MTDKEFEALEQQYAEIRDKLYEEKSRREQLEKTKKQLKEVKNVFQNDWYSIGDITLTVRVGYCVGQDGNSGYRNETLKLDITNKDLFGKYIKQYADDMQKQIDFLINK